MSLVVVGSVAFDSLKTPHGDAPEILGGAATHFSVTASYFVPVRVVAVVGEDFREEHLMVFRNRGIDTTGLDLEEVVDRCHREASARLKHLISGAP